MMFTTLQKIIGTTAIAATLTLSGLPKPAAASTTGTINTILGAAAVVGGAVLYTNYEHKKQAASNVTGYTRDGGTIYGDGRVVMPNGQTIYPNDNNQYNNNQYNDNRSADPYPANQYSYGNGNANAYGYHGHNRGDRGRSDWNQQ